MLPVHALIAAVLLTPGSAQADWPQWRGAERDGCSAETGLLPTWPEGGPRLLWRTAEAGLGYSSVAVVGERLYTLGLVDGDEHVMCFDAASGKRVWSTKAGPRLANDWGDGPRSTPTVDGGAVFALTGRGHLVSIRASDGQLAWKVELVDDLGGEVPEWGYTESPLVVGELVLCTPGGDDGTMAALDRGTGKVRWRSKDVKEPAQYASALLVARGDERLVVQLVMNQLFALDAATGAKRWSAPFPGRTAVIPTPVLAGDLVYVTAGYGVGCAAFRLVENGRAVAPAYDNKVMKNHHGGVVRVGDHVYGHSDGPGWTCQDLATGEEVWSDRSLGKGAVTYADGRLYCLDEGTGEVVLAEASPAGWRVHGRFMPGPLSERRSKQGGVWSHLVVANGRLYVRDQEVLFCYDVRRSDAAAGR